MDKLGFSLYFTRELSRGQEIQLGVGAFAGLSRGASAATVKLNLLVAWDPK